MYMEAYCAFEKLDAAGVAEVGCCDCTHVCARQQLACLVSPAAASPIAAPSPAQLCYTPQLYRLFLSNLYDALEDVAAAQM